MRARAVSLTIVAFLLGALAAGGIGVRVIREVKTADDATSLPPSNIAPEADSGYFVDPNETLIASVALTPDRMAVDDTRVSIDYDLTSLAPQAGWAASDTDVSASDVTLIYPRTWVLDTSDGIIVGGPESVTDRSARFPVTKGFSTEDVTAVRITEAFALFPIDVPFTISETTPIVDVGFGVTVELIDVTAGDSVSTVQLAVETDDPTLTQLFVAGAGPGWLPAGYDTEDGRSATLTWVGGPLPDEIRLRASGSVWTPIEGEFTVLLDGVS